MLFHSQNAKRANLAVSPFLNVVGGRGLLAASRLALRAVAEATFSRFARVKPPSEVPRSYLGKIYQVCFGVLMLNSHRKHRQCRSDGADNTDVMVNLCGRPIG